MKRDPGSIATLHALFIRPASRARLDAFRDRRIRHLVAHAYRNVPHYRDLMRSSAITPDDIRGVRDLPKIPPIPREALQQHPERFIADGIDRRRLTSIWSAGSTGRKVTIHRTPGEDLLMGAIRRRVDAALGRHPRMRTAQVAFPRPGRRLDWRLRAARALGFFRREPVDYALEPLEIAERLRAMRPRSVGGFAGVIARVADAVGPGGLADLRVELVTVGGEVVTPGMRSRIERAFEAPVREFYGCVEFFALAWQCPDDAGLHVCDDNVVFEVLRGDLPAREGEAGEVVVTGLHQYAMPLIRYRLGDVATQGAPSCPCGSPYSTIRNVQGRVLDYLALPDGRVMHPWVVGTRLLVEQNWMGLFRVTQRRPDLVVVEIKPATTPSGDQIAEVERHCRSVLGPDVEVRVDLVEDLPLEPSGKFRAVRSLIGSSTDDPDWGSVVDDPRA